MPQRKQLAWSELKVGVFVMLGVLVVAVAIFYVTSSSGAFSPKYRLSTFMPEVDGLNDGAPVSLDGIQIGSVEHIIVNTQAEGNRDRSIQVVLRLRRLYQNDVRTDSKASLVTAGVLGDRFVNISRGFTGVALQPNQEIPASKGKDFRDITEQGAQLTEKLNDVLDQVQDIVGDVKSGKGTIGKLLEDPTLANHLNSTMNNVDKLIAGVQAGQGTLGKLVVSDDLYNKANSIAGRTDDLFAAIQQQKGTLGKFIYDPSIHDEAKTFLHNGNGLLSDARGGKGTLGKLITDDSLFQKYEQVGTNLSTLTSKMNSNEGTFGKFFNDPQLYDNLTGLTGDMRLLFKDFRQDPKKFLRVRFSIF